MVVETVTCTSSGLIVVLFHFVRASGAQTACKRGNGAEVLAHVIGQQGPARNIMRTVKVLKESKIADRTLLHLHRHDPSCRKADTSPCPCTQNNYGRRWERMRNAAHLRPKKRFVFNVSGATGRRPATGASYCRSPNDIG